MCRDRECSGDRLGGLGILNWRRKDPKVPKEAPDELERDFR